jgi:transposase
MLDAEAHNAAEFLGKTGQITVLVQDNGPIHKSDAVKERIPLWEAQGLYLFHLPPYCSQMNRIEDEWHQLKAHEIAGVTFEDEYDLAMSVIQAVEARARNGGYTAKRFRFSSVNSSQPLHS